ncbi:MAG: hypothetical protein CBC48_03685 [bacterium TMED88]|nr:hypothetical protein [Deltaproteobacteria bacterium]OUV35570.1 MAG: hypothetical protein CBC48_03685 [bacterium TMED88]
MEMGRWSDVVRRDSFAELIKSTCIAGCSEHDQNISTIGRKSTRVLEESGHSDFDTTAWKVVNNALFDTTLERGRRKIIVKEFSKTSTCWKLIGKKAHYSKQSRKG